MAAESNNKTVHLAFFDKKNRDLMNKLRDSGMEYVTQNGKLVPAKKQAAICCYCPQLCQRKLPREKWKELFRQFYSLADQTKQNTFLKTHISVHMYHYNPGKRESKNKRRITCKYMVPDLEPDQHIQQYLDEPCKKIIQVCQKAFMNAFGISEKRIRMQRERSAAESEFPAPFPYNLPQVKPAENDQPLDLSNHSYRNEQIDIDKTKLYELADTLGIPRKTVDEEMMSKYEKLVRNSLEKQKRDGLVKKRKETPAVNLKGISQQVVGLEENLTILPMQTLNNGDLTITPLLGPVTVENHDIMTVNLFFQNQLWRPELIGLPAKSESPIFI